MDVILAKTFLAIVESGNFLRASKALHVTQSTVSARVKSLEDQLGKSLFVRTKSRCELTGAGEKFRRFAASMVRIWEEARHQVAVPAGFTSTLFVGGQYSLWNRLLLWWLPEFQKVRTDVAVRCEIGTPGRLMRALSQGVIDLAVVYRPEHRVGLKIERLIDDTLILVTADANADVRNNYVFIHWGEAFRAEHALHFGELHNPGLTLDLGALGVNHIINQKASGYFPERIVQPHIDAGLLHRVADAPVFSYPVYLAYQKESAISPMMFSAIGLLKEVAAKLDAGALPAPLWV